MLIEGLLKPTPFQKDVHLFKVMDANAITLTFKLKPFEHCLVILKDPNHQIRILTTFKTRVNTYHLVSDESLASPCVFNGIILDGVWKLEIIKFYQIEAKYQIEISFNQNNSDYFQGFNPLIQDFDYCYKLKKAYYVGDLHLHSFYTDGRVSYDQINTQANLNQLDFIAVSDHSIFTNHFVDTKLLVVPSSEITFDNLGHYNLHGLKEVIDYALLYDIFNGDKNHIINYLFQKTLAANGVVCINHPFTYLWNINHQLIVDSRMVIEVINSPFLLQQEVDNDKAINFFDFLWQRKITMTAVGGSDAHKLNYNDKYPVGVPKNHFYLEYLSVNQLLDAIRKGRGYISVNVDVSFSFKANNQEILPGDYHLGIFDFEAQSKLKLNWEIILNGKIINRVNDFKVSGQVELLKDNYWRLQARNLKGEIVLFINPIHAISTNTNKYSLITLLSEFEKEWVF